MLASSLSSAIIAGFAVGVAEALVVSVVGVAEVSVVVVVVGAVTCVGGFACAAGAMLDLFDGAVRRAVRAAEGSFGAVAGGVGAFDVSDVGGVRGTTLVDPCVLPVESEESAA